MNVQLLINGIDYTNNLQVGFVLKDTCTEELDEMTIILNNVEDEKLYVTSLEFLSRCLEAYFNKKVIILIDEYDVPLENSFFEGFYKEMVSFRRSIFESALKTNPSLELFFL